MAEQTKSGWTFFSNHAHVLIFVSQNPDARIRDIADAVGITERFAHSVLTDLVDSGYLTATKSGRRNEYTVNADRRFRHPLESHVEVRELLDIFGHPTDLTQ